MCAFLARDFARAIGFAKQSTAWHFCQVCSLICQVAQITNSKCKNLFWSFLANYSNANLKCKTLRDALTASLRVCYSTWYTKKFGKSCKKRSPTICYSHLPKSFTCQNFPPRVQFSARRIPSPNQRAASRGHSVFLRAFPGKPTSPPENLRPGSWPLSSRRSSDLSWPPIPGEEAPVLAADCREGVQLKVCP